MKKTEMLRLNLTKFENELLNEYCKSNRLKNSDMIRFAINRSYDVYFNKEEENRRIVVKNLDTSIFKNEFKEIFPKLKSEITNKLEISLYVRVSKEEKERINKMEELSLIKSSNKIIKTLLYTYIIKFYNYEFPAISYIKFYHKDLEKNKISDDMILEQYRNILKDENIDE